MVQHLLVSSSQDCERLLHSWFCAFLSNHLLLVSFLLQQSFEKCPRFPQFQHSIESLFLTIGSSLPGCDGHFCFVFRAFAWHLHSQYVLFSQDTIRIQPRTVQLHMFLEISELMRKSSARVCAFPWASRRPQKRLTRSSILSMAPINSGSSTRDGDKISLKRLRSRPAVYGSHLLCNLRQLSNPRSPPTDATTSKLSPSVRATAL